jgi:hypothetical protein
MIGIAVIDWNHLCASHPVAPHQYAMPKRVPAAVGAINNRRALTAVLRSTRSSARTRGDARSRKADASAAAVRCSAADADLMSSQQRDGSMNDVRAADTPESFFVAPPTCPPIAPVLRSL